MLFDSLVTLNSLETRKSWNKFMLAVICIYRWKCRRKCQPCNPSSDSSTRVLGSCTERRRRRLAESHHWCKQGLSVCSLFQVLTLS